MPTDTLERLNSCLRGEISAAETYKQAIDKLNDDEHEAEALRLHGLQRQHGMAAQRIRERIEELGGKADNSSGAWGAFAKGVQSTADLLGDRAALKSLKEGEEHGLHQYEEILADADSLDPLSRGLLGRLAEQQQRHINEVDRIMDKV